MTDDIKLGVLVPTGEAQWAGARGAGGGARALTGFAARAEDLGFDSLWVNDSLLTPRIEALTMLAALAPVTGRVTLGTAALLPVLRRPVLAAQILASVDQLSGGRLVVAVGAGFPGRFGQPLHDLSGVPWERRFARLDETVALWRQLWASSGPSSFHGSIHSFDEIPQATAPHQPGGPPIWLGGASPAALRRTGRLYDGWLPYPPDPAGYASGLAQISRAAAGAGRAPGTVHPAMFVSVLVAGSVAAGREALEGYAQGGYGLTLAELEKIQAVVTGPPQEVAAQLRRYTEAGARHLVCRLGATGLVAQCEQLAELAAIAPLLRQP